MPLGAFVGREDEVAQLRRLAHEAEDGRPRVAWVHGMAGAGKSALLHASGSALSPFLTLRADAVEGAEVVPMWLFGRLISEPPSDPYAAGLELLARLAAEQADRPVALVIEDLHWVDHASQQALAVALHRLQHGDRVLGLVTSRSDAELSEGWQRLGDDPDRCERIALSPLSPSDVAALAVHHGVTLSGRAAAALCEHTNGHPLHVRTLLDELTPAQLEAEGPLPAPRSLAAATAARAARLPQAELELVAALAVVGGRFPVAQLAGLIGGGKSSGVAVGAAVTAGLVTLVDGDDPVLEFTHPLHRAAIYDDLSPIRRRDLHLAASRTVLDPVDAMWHRIRAADHADDELAGDIEALCSTVSDPASAARLLAVAADLSVASGDKERRVVAAAERAVAAGDVASVRTLVPRLESLSDTSERNYVLGWLAWHDGDGPTAERWLRAATTSPAVDEQTPAEAWLQLGSIQALQSRGADAIGSANAALSSGALGADDDRAWLVMVRGLGQAEGGVRALELLAERFPDPWEPDEVEPEQMRVRAVQHFFAAQPLDGVAWFDAALQRGERGPLVHNLAHMHLMRAECQHMLGSWDAALLDAHRAVELAIDLQQLWVLPQCRALAARVHAGQGRFDLAAQHLEGSASTAASTTSYEAHGMWATASAAIAHARGDHLGVVASLDALYSDDPAMDVPMADTLIYWPTYIHALIDADRLDDGRRSIDRYRRATAQRSLVVDAQVAALEGHLALASGRTDAGRDSLARAVSEATPETNAIDRMMAGLRYGQLLRSTGQRQLAAEVLRETRALMTTAHAAPYLERVDAELAAIGEIVEGGGRRSRFDLTDRERDVATQVCRGLTNKEIAAELYVSVKAVEYHLGNIYAKFGVNNRRALRTMLDA